MSKGPCPVPIMGPHGIRHDCSFSKGHEGLHLCGCGDTPNCMEGKCRHYGHPHPVGFGDKVRWTLDIRAGRDRVGRVVRNLPDGNLLVNWGDKHEEDHKPGSLVLAYPHED